MKLNLSAINNELVYPFVWIKNFFDASLSVPIQILALRDWTKCNDEIDGHFKENYEYNVPRTAKKLREFLRISESKELFKFVSRASGKEVYLQSSSFRSFEDGDYLASNINQDITLTLFLSDHWQRNWGGITEFKKNEIWGAVANPTFGSALLQFPHPVWLSRITKIEPEAPISRLSIVLRFREKS